jgi:hypothetical protein
LVKISTELEVSEFGRKRGCRLIEAIAKHEESDGLRQIFKLMIVPLTKDKMGEGERRREMDREVETIGKRDVFEVGGKVGNKVSFTHSQKFDVCSCFWKFS